ncbi:MAG TPA: hypothetical protein VGE78_02535, partial [Agromyces sp.]
ARAHPVAGHARVRAARRAGAAAHGARARAGGLPAVPARARERPAWAVEFAVELVPDTRPEIRAAYAAAAARIAVDSGSAAVDD